MVGLCLGPPEKALVLLADEMSQIRALDRSQLVLSMLTGIPRTSQPRLCPGQCHQLVRRIGSGDRQGHRIPNAADTGAVDSKESLARLDIELPALEVHLILGNYATHKTPEGRKQLLAHPHFHLRFAPTSSSWLNLVERWFAELTQERRKRGIHRSIQVLERDVRVWLVDWNGYPRPFVWAKTADETLDKGAVSFSAPVGS
ncbi:transposase [Streptomyces sioyaensis]|uniref:transposase n=1 Tax=Streptomyces sioyaensis TaxID=67364 RepID=UPI00371A9865